MEQDKGEHEAVNKSAPPQEGPPPREDSSSTVDPTSTGEPPPKKDRRWLYLILAAAVVLVVIALAMLAKQPQFTVECGTGATTKSVSGQPSEPPPFFHERQIIVTGPSTDEVESVTSVVRATRGLEPDRTCAAYQGLRLDFGPLKGRHLPWQRNVLETRLYTLNEGESVAKALEDFEDVRDGRPVFADANYLTGLLGLSSCGSRHSIGPSPYQFGPNPFESVEWSQPESSSEDAIEALKHSIGPSPLGTASQATARQFREQWGFEHIGLSPWPTATMPLTVLPTGSGILAAVFDTSPFPEPAAGAAGSSWASGPVKISLTAVDGVKPTWEFELLSPEMPTMTVSGEGPAADVQDHGLFVSGLIHGIAPESDIQLVRVLNKYGCGELFALNEALLEFVHEVEGRRNSLDGVVINLSLGLQKPTTDTEVVVADSDQVRCPPPVGDSIVLVEYDALEGTYPQEDDNKPVKKSICVYIDKDLTVLVEDKVESLQNAINVAHERGIVVVAAAGNDSGKDSIPLSPHLPAAYPSVIGVAGSNIGRQRSCFSNWGDVSAPAGDGGKNPDLLKKLKEAYGDDQVQGSDCMPVVDKCTGKCATGLTSLAKNLFKGNIGYAHWSGTSFAAPLVSGLAALILDEGTTGAPGADAWVPPTDVFATVRCGAPTGDGVIDVLTSLYRCMP